MFLNVVSVEFPPVTCLKHNALSRSPEAISRPGPSFQQTLSWRTQSGILSPPSHVHRITTESWDRAESTEARQSYSDKIFFFTLFTHWASGKVEAGHFFFSSRSSKRPAKKKKKERKRQDKDTILQNGVCCPCMQHAQIKPAVALRGRFATLWTLLTQLLNLCVDTECCRSSRPWKFD